MGRCSHCRTAGHPGDKLELAFPSGSSEHGEREPPNISILGLQNQTRSSSSRLCSPFSFIRVQAAGGTSVLIALAGLVRLGSAQAVVGKAEGFAAGVTGGGNAKPDFPEDIEELAALLTDSTPRVIVLSKEFDFTESEGTETGTACQSWGTGSACQKIIQDDCGSNPAIQGTWFKAPRTPIDVASDKTILGVGDKGIIKGKGLRFTNGVSNVIVQNIQVTDLNPEFVWGGDAIGFSGSDLIWIDHVTTARPGRQHYVFGFEPSTRITLSNNFIDGDSPFSTGCGNGYHYWTFEMVGTDDQITMKGNYISHTSGRSPALSGGTLLHAVNNVWEDNDGHALEGGDSKARGIYEGNVFINVNSMVADYAGRLFSSPSEDANTDCELALGRPCVVNILENSKGDFSYSDTSFFSEFSGLEIASAVPASQAQTDVPKNAGAGKIDTSASGEETEAEAPAASEPEAAEPDVKEPVVQEPVAEPVAEEPTEETPAEETPAEEPVAQPATGSVARWGQCGGQGYTGATTCAEGKCVKQNDWYSQCL
ncbi:pectin lyase [Paramyrothecium foliicola]|nr:pectin lyase [Paramyrothecium foliicola]